MVSVFVCACDFGVAGGLFSFCLGLAYYGADSERDDCSGDCGVSHFWFVVVGLAKWRVFGRGLGGMVCSCLGQ